MTKKDEFLPILREFYFLRKYDVRGRNSIPILLLCQKCAVLGSKFWLEYQYAKEVILLKQAQQIVARPGLGNVNGLPLGIGGMLLFS